MKKSFYLLLACWLFACGSGAESHSDHAHGHEQAAESDVAADTVKGSPLRMAMANIGNAHVHIQYSSPAVRNRIIWGGLVAFGEVWVTGAHDATSIQFSKPVEIAATQIPAGKYAFFTIPGKDEWTLILNKNWEQHLADEYSANEDVLRWKVKPENHSHSERLTYSVTPTGDTQGSVSMSWEKLRIQFEIKQNP
ncbi:MAG: DUF2911 domain-containing protein [Bacteroidetes bacterium]|jgi:hypothetical protein|nr:MAG: DUF2911 domain-containing protein [Bacteroidota bacterium]